MNGFHSALIALALASVAWVPANAAPSHAIAPAAASSKIEAQQTCHHVLQTSRRHCTSTRLLQQALRPPLYYPRRYYGTRHYYYPFAYYGYRPYYYPYGFYRPYWGYRWF